MEARAAAVRAGEAAERVWLLEHPPLFTAGTSADPAELFNPQGFPVFEAGRGGRYTYHGPGAAGRLPDARPRRPRPRHPLLRPCA
jgi:lipoyl(octanoyl) transferase